MGRAGFVAMVLAAVGSGAGAWAEPGSLFRSATFGAGERALVQDTGRAFISADPFQAPTRGASLFIGKEGQSFFAPLPERKVILRAAQGPVAMLRDLIAQAEAGAAQYDAVQHGARVKPAKPPTQMRLSEIYAWIKATPGQPHAIGRYQFIPATLRRLVKVLDVPTDAYFTAEIQDRLANQLLLEAGLRDFLSGSLPAPAFQDNLAKIWAGLPTQNGRSHYHGYAGNKAVLTRAEFDAHFARIFPG